MAVQNKVKAIELQSIASSGVGASYAAINSGGLEKACYFLKIINDSNQDVTVSFDGETNHDYVVTATTEHLVAQNNAQPPNWVALWPKGMVVYVKGTAGTGNIYLSGYYVER